MSAPEIHYGVKHELKPLLLFIEVLVSEHYGPN